MREVNFQVTRAHMVSQLDIDLINIRKTEHKEIFNKT
jgi:hypothetical protein